MWIAFIFMSERTRQEDIPKASMTLCKNINERGLHSHTHTHTHTHIIPACRMTFDFTHTTPCTCAEWQGHHTQSVFCHLCLSHPKGYLTLPVIHIVLHTPPLTSRRRLVWPQLPGLNHKHSNYLINRGPLLKTTWWASLVWLCLVKEHANSHGHTGWSGGELFSGCIKGLGNDRGLSSSHCSTLSENN